MNFTQQYGKNRQRCQKNTFYYAVWQLLLYYYGEFASKIAIKVVKIKKMDNETKIQLLKKVQLFYPSL